jgi:hypothetical protein
LCLHFHLGVHCARLASRHAVTDLDGVPSGYQDMADRKSLKVLIRPLLRSATPARSRVGWHRGREFELVVIGVAEHHGGVGPVRPAADAGVADVELVEPVDPGLKRRPVGDLEGDVVQAGMALLELLALVGVVVVQAPFGGW